MNRKLLALLVGLLVLMAGLMIGAARQETATVDETTALGAGWALWRHQGVRMVVDHPPLVQLLSALPVSGEDLKLSRDGQALLSGSVTYPWTRPWSGPILETRVAFPQGVNWYHWPAPESQLFGQIAVFGSGNDGERMLFLGRLMFIAMTLLTGLVIFAWARQLAGDEAGVMAAALWTLNTVALAYGHLILTDGGATLMMTLSIWAVSVYLEKPTRRHAVFLGLATAGALVTKYSAVMLGPIYILLAFLWWMKQPKKSRTLRPHMRTIPWSLVSGYTVILLVFLPHCGAPPPLPAEQAQRLGVPGWFQACRPLLLPGLFFKGLALAVGHAAGGHNAFLCGEWRETGWWYYFPVVIVLKTPLPLLAAIALALVLLLRQWRKASFAQFVPWVVAGAYLFFAMISSINIGIRHIFPMYPLLAVATAAQLARSAGRLRLLAWGLCGCLGLVALLSYPLYIPSFNLLAGGPDNGYKYLIDSNYDWGQDGQRLKQFLQQRGIRQIYLDYFGTQMEIDYLGIPNTRINATQARQIQQGYLVVSASELMRPDWAWLRESRQPIARVAYTLFVYQF